MTLSTSEREAIMKCFFAPLESGVQFVFIFFVPKCFKVELILYMVEKKQVLLHYFDFKLNLH